MFTEETERMENKYTDLIITSRLAAQRTENEGWC